MSTAQCECTRTSLFSPTHAMYLFFVLSVYVAHGSGATGDWERYEHGKWKYARPNTSPARPHGYATPQAAPPPVKRAEATCGV